MTLDVQQAVLTYPTADREHRRMDPLEMVDLLLVWLGAEASVYARGWCLPSRNFSRAGGVQSAFIRSWT